ncbi:MAG TPA: valine--tRNA ligase [Candidatus Nanoarchaeia archaeon]|nr:valine--tRNA ligase [Candidatus Nanoarchaeia archaeon]
MELPRNYDPQVEEPKWQKYWEEQKVFAFNPKSKAEIYSVDTPPPTVSGKMHIGHAFSYAQQDFVVRYERMRGKNVFYPFGTDDNGLATERLIEKSKSVRAKDMPREEFVNLCLETLENELRPKYVADWKRIGMSCDWSIFYTTINEHCQRISQRSFIELYKKGREYRKDAPTMWCPQCQTGVSQVECQDQVLDSTFNDIVFKVDGDDLIIATTRPELLPACVAVFYHPEDKRYQNLKSKKAKVPLFDLEVPILPDERADPAKGTGIVMCCTFGDQTDMEWQKAHDLPIRLAITVDGKMTELAGKYAGLPIKNARKMIIDDLKANGLLVKQEPIKHAVNVHERCKAELEIIPSKQWFIKYLDLKDDMLKWGNELNWYPKHMKVRYDHWVKGLQWDWLISRQRFFGVPFPVWYCSKCEEVILARKEDLPVDPTRSKAPVKKCPKCGGTEFIPETDVMDTWATSSLTPQLAVELFSEEEVYKNLFPMRLRPQAHDIITFWLFNTVVKSRLHYNSNPWKDVIISGHALDPRGKKMSKSLGNVVEPQEMIKKYSADALRFWAASSKLGEDLPFMEKDLVTGQKFIVKLWNASKFCFMHLEDFDAKKKIALEPVDKWLLSRLSAIIKNSTESFEKYEYARTKADIENFFWHEFCDYYLEIIKDRLYNPDRRGKEARESAQYGLYHGLLSILKLMAPIMPHITEEVYKLYYAGIEGKKSIHISRWPDLSMNDEKAEKIAEVVLYAVESARRAKSDKNVSLKSPIKRMVVDGKISEKEFDSIKEEIINSAWVEELVYKMLPKDSKKNVECAVEI